MAFESCDLLFSDFRRHAIGFVRILFYFSGQNINWDCLLGRNGHEKREPMTPCTIYVTEYDDDLIAKRLSSLMVSE